MYYGTCKIRVSCRDNYKKLTYDTFGNIISDSNKSLKVPFGFAGGLYDSDTKLVRFGFRDYDPHTGRWTAKDPMLFAGVGALLEENHPAILKDKVMSPAGTTAAGYSSLEKDGVRGSFIEAMSSAYKRAEELSKN